MDAITELLKQGRMGEAETALRHALADRPDDAQALRLLGTVCHVTGRVDEARDLLQRALAQDPEDTRTLQNLGSVHLAHGRTGEALDCFSRLVALDPDSADGHFNLGIAAQQGGDLEQAERAYRRALECDASLLDAAVNLAVVHFHQGRFDESLDCSGGVLDVEPAHPQAFLLHARTLLVLSRAEDAERLLAHAPAGVRQEAGYHALSGKVHFLGGRLHEAAAAYGEARRLGDTRLDSALDLARCLLESGDAAAAIDVLRDTTARFADAADAHALLGLAQLDAGDVPAALEAYDRALTLDPDSADHCAMRAHALFVLGRDVEADQALDAAIAMAPAVVSPHLMRVEQRVSRGDLAGALDACERYLSQRGPECSLLAARGFLLYALGRDAEGARLLDYDRLLTSQMIDVPPGYASLGDFNAALARHIRAHPSLSEGNAASRATQIGRQSGNLFHGDRGPFVDFEQVLWGAAARYREFVGRDPQHPFLARPPPLGAVYSWAVVLERSGYQTPHIHPTAWLSGVYYPELPAAIREGDSEQGWIEFGAPPPEFDLDPPAPRLRIQPREGLLVLFPSYFYHRTVPCDSDEQRVSIAFDFSPAKG